jgi:DNA-binding transcriptional ArsR family regulator
MAEKRQLTDATEMRALAHPVRIALLELLAREGPLTATQAGEQLGESPANASFHLRTLARYGFVEEAPGGTGRQRPWQRVSQVHAFDLDIEDTSAAVAANALSNFFIDRNRDRRRAWNETYTSFPKPWRDASFAFDTVTYMTSEELEAVGEQMIALLEPYSERMVDRSQRPDGAMPVNVVITGHPLPPTASGN